MTTRLGSPLLLEAVELLGQEVRVALDAEGEDPIEALHADDLDEDIAPEAEREVSAGLAVHCPHLTPPTPERS